MLGQAPWSRLSPSGSAILLLALCTAASMSSQDICSPPGYLQAPALQMNSTSAQPGTRVFLQCILPVVSPVRKIIFCKDGKEVYSLKAQQGQLNYSVVLNITSRSAGRYTCGYKEWNEMKHMRSSALSAGRILDIPGAGAGMTTQDICSSPGNVVSSPASPPPPDPHAWIPHALPTSTVLAVAAVGLVLLSTGSWFAIRKGACRGRCPRQQHVDSPQMETTDHGEVTCEYYLLPWRQPCTRLRWNPTTSFPTGIYKIPACSSRPGFSPAPYVLLLPCMQSVAAACTRDMAACQCSQGQSPFAWGVPSTPAPSSGCISPASASAFVLSSVSLHCHFCFKNYTKYITATKAVALFPCTAGENIL
eukprot:XP_027326298.1 uncharacterized protein LOC113845395 isoform X2 [Anas platyrhynchos]